MAAQRLLGLCVVALVAGPAAAEPTPVPRWVRVSLASAGVANLTSQATAAAEKASPEKPFEAAVAAGDVAYAARNLFRNNARLLGGRTLGGTAALGKLSAALGTVATLTTVADFTYDLANGNLSASQAGRNAVQFGASSAAASLTLTGMVWFAGSVGTASTGTAIASLSGAAYTSAATAWWGGGAAAAGGGGMFAGSAVMTGGAVLVAAGVGYGVYKAWNVLDPAERDAMNTLADGFGKRADLTDACSARGAALLADSRRLEEIARGRKLLGGSRP